MTSTTDERVHAGNGQARSALTRKSALVDGSMPREERVRLTRLTMSSPSPTIHTYSTHSAVRGQPQAC